MAVYVAGALIILLSSMINHSSGATYCLCKDGVSDQLLQKDIDYACGNGADCSQILQAASCYNPNTIKDHCNYAVNSYYQRKNQAPDTCDFTATAIVSQTPPPNTNSGCVYPSGPGNPGNTPTVPSPPGSPTTPILSPPGSFPPPPGFIGIPPPGFGPGANGSGINPDNTGSGVRCIHQWSTPLTSLTLTLVISGLIWFTD